MEHLLPIIWVIAGIAILLTLTVKFKFNSMLSLLLVSILVAFLEGMGPVQVVDAITNGASSTLGGMAFIVILGAILGQLMTDSGASKKVADTIISKCGISFLQCGLMVIGLIFGLSMFYEVAFMILTPLVINIAKEAKIPYMRLVIPAIAAATMSHSVFPPQPGPVALVESYGADLGKVYILGIIMIIPTIICAGLILPKFLKSTDSYALPALGTTGSSSIVESTEHTPSFGICIFVPLIPAILMIAKTIVTAFLPETHQLAEVFTFLGSSNISMLISVLFAIFLFGSRAGRSSAQVSDSITSAIKSIATVVIVIGAGGVFKQVIVDAGVGNHIATVVSNLSINPLILAWFITVILRLATGQGAVSAITAAGIVGPLIAQFNIDPTLMVLATAAGSNTISMPNDAGFWLFKETLDLNIGQTFKTWGLMELINSVVGLIIVLLMSLFI